MTPFLRTVLLVAILLEPCGRSIAASPEDRPADAASADAPMTLRDAIRLGLAHDPSLAADRAESEAARADVEASRGSRWPRLLAEAGWHLTDDPVMVFGDKLTSASFGPSDFAIPSLNHPSPAEHGVAALRLELPVDVSGRLRSQIDAAGQTSLGAAARLRSAEMRTVAAVTEAYYGASLAIAASGIARSGVDNAAAHEAVARARFEEGAALESDWLRARVYRRERERDREKSLADEQMARTALGVLLGVDEADGPTVVPADLPDPEGDPGDLEGWRRRAAERPEVEVSRFADRAAREVERAERASLAPDLAASFTYERNARGLGAGEGSYVAGIGLRWTAFDRGRGARLDAAAARARAAEAATRAAWDRARLETERAYRDGEVARRQLESASAGIADAERALRISDERYAAGLSPLSDLLDAETALLHARLAALTARFDSLVARVRLERAAGRLEVPR